MKERSRAVPCSTKHSLRGHEPRPRDPVVDTGEAAKQDQVDPVAERRCRVEKIGSLAAGETGLVRVQKLPGVPEAAVDDGLIGRECRIRRVVGGGVEVAGEDNRQRRVARGLDKLLSLRQLNRRAGGLQACRHEAQRLAANDGIESGPVSSGGPKGSRNGNYKRRRGRERKMRDDPRAARCGARTRSGTSCRESTD